MCCKEDSSNQRDRSVQEIASTNQEPLIKPQGKKKLGLMRKMTVKNQKDKTDSDVSGE